MSVNLMPNLNRFVVVQNPSVVRCFALEEDGEFVYLALERCKQSLADLLNHPPPLQQLFVDSDGHPTPLCMQVLTHSLVLHWKFHCIALHCSPLCTQSSVVSILWMMCICLRAVCLPGLLQCLPKLIADTLCSCFRLVCGPACLPACL